MGMPESEARALQIKKYSNRRFYDATRSRHVTLPEMHDLICAGCELHITDSKSGEDITNQVLTQIILERDPLKLGVFPANILHEIIRTQQQLLGSVVDQYFRQMLEVHRASQQRWIEFVRNTLGAGLPPAAAPAAAQPASQAAPFDVFHWVRPFVDALAPAARGAAGEPAARPNSEACRNGKQSELDELRRQVAELSRRLDELSAKS